MTTCPTCLIANSASDERCIGCGRRLTPKPKVEQIENTSQDAYTADAKEVALD
jgi:hypothetical protein